MFLFLCFVFCVLCFLILIDFDFDFDFDCHFGKKRGGKSGRGGSGDFLSSIFYGTS